jgi:hypothetical protein
MQNPITTVKSQGCREIYHHRKTEMLDSKLVSSVASVRETPVQRLPTTIDILYRQPFCGKK